VWFTAQASGHLGWFDPKGGRTELIALGNGSSPHGVIQGPDKAAWITDSGQNAIVRVGWPDRKVQVLRLPQGSAYANLNTCAFDGGGDLWFTGQGGWLGKVAVKTGEVTVKDADAAPTASARRRRATFGGAPWQAPSSRGSTGPPANR
jgi:virginiamycin B lyase